MKTMNARLDGQTAIVTGAARGIGAAVAAALADAGATVIATDVLADELEKTAAELGDAVTAAHLDVSDENGWQELVDKTLADSGRIDVLVNNAGILAFSTIEDTDPGLFRKMLEINLTGSFLGMRAVIPAMKKAGSGAIVNLSSSAAILPHNATGAYAASKFGVRGLTRASALELGPFGIRVNSVHPGGVNTPMTNPQGLSSEELAARFRFVPQQRGSEANEIAAAIVFLASDQASYCNGTELVVDGGMTAGLYVPGMPGAPF
jgi:3alpha(or 20beta)-hydroxysteroid dehydrogenase